MARIQILELPTEHRGDDTITPFALVIDRAESSLMDPEGPTLKAMQSNLAERLGARAVLIFEETIEIPANEVPVDPDGYPLKIRVEGDFETFHEQVQDEIRKAQAEMGGAGLRRSV
ncbi:hypothetical protein [Streptomyces sp. AC555_RSS877]|uniref:hypothetical protein n=1 Tax=Streptomyces sp. AC555_RSS877 TaxID=2823688 RepID=UPI001C26BA01|nr:hypothetical protein [Streptomyces sp. AC555_RSS877]